MWFTKSLPFGSSFFTNDKMLKLINEFLYKIKEIPIDDRLFIEFFYFYRLHKKLVLREPRCFNEKIQWLKLFGNFEHNAYLADKYLVRKYVADKVGEHYLNKLFFVFESAKDIDFNLLPPKFVLKASHASGWNTICGDKSVIDFEEERKKCNYWLEHSYFYAGREPVYKYLKPRIVCEQYIEGENQNQGINDYKFFCFHGIVKFIQTDFDRYTNHKRNVYDRLWNKCKLKYTYSNYDKTIDPPKLLTEMILIAEKLSEGIPFVRIDLYQVKNSIIFGEMTFFPGGGFEKFEPDYWDKTFGDFIDLTALDKK